MGNLKLLGPYSLSTSQREWKEECRGFFLKVEKSSGKIRYLILVNLELDVLGTNNWGNCEKDEQRQAADLGLTKRLVMHQSVLVLTVWAVLPLSLLFNKYLSSIYCVWDSVLVLNHKRICKAHLFPRDIIILGT